MQNIWCLGFLSSFPCIDLIFIFTFSLTRSSTPSIFHLPAAHTPLAWSALQAWHDGGPPIHRTVVTYPAPPSSIKSPAARNTKADDARALAAALLGNDSAKKKKKEKVEDGQHDIELYPLFVTVMLCDAPSGGEPRPFQQQVPLSRQKPIRSLVDEICEDLEVNPMDCRLWMRGKDVATAMIGPDGTPC